MTKPHGTMRLRRSAGGGRPEVWEVKFDGKRHQVQGDVEAARQKLVELAAAKRHT